MTCDPSVKPPHVESRLALRRIDTTGWAIRTSPAGRERGVTPRTLDRRIREELEEFLQAELARLEGSLRALARESRAAEKTALTDVNLHAAEALEAEMQMTLLDRRAQQVAQIQGALERLSSGEYGLCQDCDAFVGLPRLRALPFAQRCRECQSRMERQLQREALAPPLVPRELEAA